MLSGGACIAGTMEMESCAPGPGAIVSGIPGAGCGEGAGGQSSLTSAAAESCIGGFAAVALAPPPGAGRSQPKRVKGEAVLLAPPRCPLPPTRRGGAFLEPAEKQEEAGVLGRPATVMLAALKEGARWQRQDGDHRRRLRRPASRQNSVEFCRHRSGIKQVRPKSVEIGPESTKVARHSSKSCQSWPSSSQIVESRLKTGRVRPNWRQNRTPELDVFAEKVAEFAPEVAQHRPALVQHRLNQPFPGQSSTTAQKLCSGPQTKIVISNHRAFLWSSIVSNLVTYVSTPPPEQTPPHSAPSPRVARGSKPRARRHPLCE